MTSHSSRPLVVQILPTLEGGGAERIVYELASRLPARGFDVHLIALMGGGRLLTDFVRAGVHVSVVPKRGPFGSFGFFFAFRRLRELRPSIVHTHLFGADLWGRLAAILARTPILLSTEHNVSRVRSRLQSFLLALLARPSRALVAVSDTVKREMISRDKIPAKKIRVIRNGIDLSHVVQRTARPFHDIPRLLIVGRLEPQKGHATLFKALALVTRPWRLEIAGTGPQERALKTLAERLRIASRIQWLGFRRDIPRLLAEADLFCAPSLWEGFGLALVEAAAAGVPIIASDLPVFHEILEDGATFAVPGDVPAFARAIRSMLENPTTVVAHASQLVQKIHTRYSIERMIGAYASLYRELLKPRAS